MEINTQLDSLPILEALGSESRLRIINLLADGEFNIKQIAEKLYLSSGIVTRHVKQLEEAGLISTKIVSTNSGSHKICRLAVDELYIRFPSNVFPDYNIHQTYIPVGHFTDYYATPTCGLATQQNYIGELDEPMYFMDSKRMEAEIIWLTDGFLEYKIPNLLNLETENPELLEISLEMASEFPVSNNNWPSDIGFYINDIYVGNWTVPGNYSDVRGKLTPDWWPDRNSQYGLLKTLRITAHETLVDGDSISEVNLNDIPLDGSLIKIKLAVENTNDHSGGLTIFGKQFGNYPQHIIYKMYYSIIDDNLM
jgi:predicted transcriptional regulator